MPRVYNPAKFLKLRQNRRWLNCAIPPTCFTALAGAAYTVTLAEGAFLAIGLTLVAALVVVVGGVCVVVWLALRGSRPQDRPAVLDAVARVLSALGDVLNRSRRR